MIPQPGYPSQLSSLPERLLQFVNLRCIVSIALHLYNTHSFACIIEMLFVLHGKLAFGRAEKV